MIPSSVIVLDRRPPDIDQGDVRAVEGLVVADVDAKPLAADDAVGAERFRGRRIVDGSADLPADERGEGVVGALVDQEIGERRHEAEPAHGPAVLEHRLALGLAHRHRRGRRNGKVDAVSPGPGAGAQRRVVGLDRRLRRRIERRVVGGHGVVRRALKDRELLRRLRDDWDRLDRRRAGADDADTPAVEGHLVMRPVAGVQNPAGEALQPLDLRAVHDREAAGGHDAVAGGEGGAVPGRDDPASVRPRRTRPM